MKILLRFSSNEANEFGVFSVLVQLYGVSQHQFQLITKDPKMKGEYWLFIDCLQSVLVPSSDPSFLRHRCWLWEAAQLEQPDTESDILNVTSSGKFRRFKIQ